jgi:hypothetical protein
LPHNSQTLAISLNATRLPIIVAYAIALARHSDRFGRRHRGHRAFRRPTYGSLEVDLTVDDPEVYTRPWHAKRYLHSMLDTELIEDICNENEKSFIHIFGK